MWVYFLFKLPFKSLLCVNAFMRRNKVLVHINYVNYSCFVNFGDIYCIDKNAKKYVMTTTIVTLMEKKYRQVSNISRTLVGN